MGNAFRLPGGGLPKAAKDLLIPENIKSGVHIKGGGVDVTGELAQTVMILYNAGIRRYGGVGWMAKYAMTIGDFFPFTMIGRGSNNADMAMVTELQATAQQAGILKITTFTRNLGESSGGTAISISNNGTAITGDSFAVAVGDVVTIKHTAYGHDRGWNSSTPAAGGGEGWIMLQI